MVWFSEHNISLSFSWDVVFGLQSLVSGGYLSDYENTTEDIARSKCSELESVLISIQINNIKT